MEGKRNVVITADSVCSIPREIAKENSISVIPFYLETKRGRFLDGEEITAKDLLDRMDEKGGRVDVIPPDPMEYKSFFEKMLEKATRVIHISSGSAFTKGLYNAKQAAKNLPGVSVVDSFNVVGGAGILAVFAARKAKKDRGASEILEEINDYKKRIRTTFVIKDSQTARERGRISSFSAALSERMMLHPVISIRKDGIATSRFLTGDWEKIVKKYVRSEFEGIKNIDDDFVIINHAGLSEKETELIRNEVEKYIHFKNVFVSGVSATLVPNCGRGAFGFIFASGGKKKDESVDTSKNKGVISWIRDFLNDNIISEKNPIKQRLVNLMCVVTVLGGIFSLFSTLFIKGSLLSLVVIAMVVLMGGLGLYLSVVKTKVRITAFLVCFSINTILFPFMFFSAGGVYSGMPSWFLLGMVIDWMVIDGLKAIPVCILHFTLMAFVIQYTRFHSELVEPVTVDYTISDIIQTLLVASCALGAVFKYNSYVYEKQKKSLEENGKELEISNNAKDIFLTNMSNELRSPIERIIRSDDKILGKDIKDREAYTYALSIRDDSRTLLSLVNDILDVSRIESGRMEINNDEYVLGEMLSDCYRIAYSRAAAKGIGILFSVNPSIPSKLYGDSIRIKQVINNFLSSAVRYTEKGDISFGVDVAKRTDATVTLEINITDSGGKIDSYREDQTHDNSREMSREMEGPGLGLRLTNSLIDLLDGEMQAESAEGMGNLITVKIPQGIRDRTPIGNLEFSLSIDDKAQVPMESSGDVLEFGSDPDASGVTSDQDVLEFGSDPDASGVTADLGVLEFTPDIDVLEFAPDTGGNTGLDIDDIEDIDVLEFAPNADNGDDNESKKGAMDKLLKNPEIDVKTGMGYCMNDERFYMSVVEEYVKGDKRKTLTEFLEKEDFENYKIVVHSLKSTSMNIGAMDISNEARKLEQACKDGDYDTVRKGHAPLMDRYGKMLEDIAL